MSSKVTLSTLSGEDTVWDWAVDVAGIMMMVNSMNKESKQHCRVLIGVVIKR
jgi:hypothetical protein